MIFAFERLAGIANSRFFTSDSIVVFDFERLAGITNSRSHLGFYSDIRFRALSWYIEFVFSLRIL